MGFPLRKPKSITQANNSSTLPKSFPVVLGSFVLTMQISATMTEAFMTLLSVSEC